MGRPAKSKLPTPAPDRIYERLARRLSEELASGRYKVGDRLPAERELAVDYQVSRPAVREAMIALEVQGLIEVRVGSGAYVRRLPGGNDTPGFHFTAIELAEARLLFEPEAAALAAAHISAADLDELDRLLGQMAREDQQIAESEEADRSFHILIARSTGNAVVLDMVERFWETRRSSPECALLHEKSRLVNGRPVVEEHRAIVSALRARDPAEARNAMRAHLSKVIDYLLFAIEERAVEEARRTVATTRERFGSLAVL